LKIKELKKKYKNFKINNVGPYDVREFHDLVLKNGALPLNILEKIILNTLVDV
jgi:uncharacterized protein (DUF885 family)